MDKTLIIPRETVIQLRNQGNSWRETCAKIIEQCPNATAGFTPSQVLRRCRNIMLTYHNNHPDELVNVKHAKGTQDVKELLPVIRKGARLPEISKAMKISVRKTKELIKEAKKRGYNVQMIGEKYILCTDTIPGENKNAIEWTGEKIIRFGLMSDTHLGCIDTQITHLHALYDTYEYEGITQVYHTGDITDGEKMRPGHEYELYVHGADAQVAHTVDVYPMRHGIVTDFITGNHDYSFIRTIGLDIGKQIAAQRPDMHYLGYGSAFIELTPNCSMELRHPENATAYAQSYKIQKIIEAMSGGEKPNILVVGHYHKMEQLFYRNVHAIQAATLCAQTRWMRGKGIAAAVGGWIVELRVDDEGSITRITSTFFPFYKAIKNDYKNWQ